MDTTAPRAGTPDPKGGWRILGRIAGIAVAAGVIALCLLTAGILIYTWTQG